MLLSRLLGGKVSAIWRRGDCWFARLFICLCLIVSKTSQCENFRLSGHSRTAERQQCGSAWVSGLTYHKRATASKKKKRQWIAILGSKCCLFFACLPLPASRIYLRPRFPLFLPEYETFVAVGWTWSGIYISFVYPRDRCK